MERRKASNAVVAVTDMYAAMLAEVEAELAQKDALLAQAAEQIKATGCHHPELMYKAGPQQLQHVLVACMRCGHEFRLRDAEAKARKARS